MTFFMRLLKLPYSGFILSAFSVSIFLCFIFYMLKPITPEKAVSLYKRGFVEFTNGRYQEAIPYFIALSELPVITENIAISYDYLVQSYAALKDFKKAYFYLEKKLKISGNNLKLLKLFNKVQTLNPNTKNTIEFLLKTYKEISAEKTESFIIPAFALLIQQAATPEQKDKIIDMMPEELKNRFKHKDI